jgi:hypothetical protein
MPGGRKYLGTKVAGVDRVMALLYADDLALLAEDAETLQRLVSCFEKATTECGLTINVSKTKVLITNPDKWRGEARKKKKRNDSSPHEEENILIRGEKVEQVEEFTYLGSIMTESGSCTRDINQRISRAAYKFNQLNKIWKQSGISLKTKTRIYRTVVMSTLLYGAEAWTCTGNEYGRLNTFHTKRLRSVMGKCKWKKREEGETKQWEKKPRNEDLLNRVGLRPMENYVRYHRMRWAGHVRRMEDSRLPKRVLFGELVGGKRAPGRPRARWEKSLEEDVELVSIPYAQWTTKADDRVSWCNSIATLTEVKKTRKSSRPLTSVKKK